MRKLENRKCANESSYFLSIVIPTYNEAENIPEVLSRLKNLSKELGDRCYEIIIVDDNSPDNTWRIAYENLHRLDLDGIVIVRENTRGIGSAIVTGIKEARGRYVAVMDADLQHPPEELINMLNAALEKNYDLVIASRYVRGGGVEGWGLHRRIISKTASLIARIIVPHARRIRDPMSGYFLFKKEKVDTSKLRGEGSKVLLEIVVRGNISSIYEHPYIFKRRTRGVSKLGLLEIIRFLIQILRLSDYKILKFAIVGVSGIGVNWSILYFLHKVMMYPTYISYAVSVEASLISNFIFNDLWTFRGDKKYKGWFRRLIEYHTAQLTGLLINYSVTVLLSFFIFYLIASFIGIVLGFVANYVISTEFVWSYRHKKDINY
ncbi:MAG: glycosyltransferase [Sulfolobales archaeon]